MEREGVSCASHSFYLAFQEFLETDPRARRVGLDIDDYGLIGGQWSHIGAGDWAFATSAIRQSNRAREERFINLCRAHGMSRKLVTKLGRLREIVPSFLEACAEEVLAGNPSVVGFSSIYSQNLPSVALAHVLKEREPSLKVVFGGASCQGSMGAALLRGFDCIDVIARGEVEGYLVELVRVLIDGEETPPLPGLCFRSQGDVIDLVDQRPPKVPMDSLPLPNYDEYFGRLEGSSLSRRILPQVLFESARGCWWGEISHCTFCGINGLDMAYRSKTAERVLEEVSTLAEKHGALDFSAVDTILDLKYLETFVPALIERDHDLSFFYETKANLTEDQVMSFRAAGINTITPGIESLSTPTLKLMKKGVTAFQNIRLLKWCRQHGLRVTWNLIYGFPGESPQEYARMASVVPSLAHLEPPSMGSLQMYRFSPYHDRPEEHGLRLGGPLPHYALLYDLDEQELGNLAQAFEYSHADERDPESYVDPLRQEVLRWQEEAKRNRGALTYRRGPGFLVITDTRTTTGVARYTLGEAEARVYMACDAGSTPKKIAAQLKEGGEASMDLPAIQALLDEFVELRLAYEENGRYLGLAVPNLV